MNELTANKNTGLSLNVENMTYDQKAKLFNAITNTDKSLNDCIGMEIECVGFFTQKKTEVEFDEATGEEKSGVITYVIAKDGQTYATNSKSCLNALQNLAQFFPHDWNDKPLVIIPIQKKSIKSSNKYLTIALK